MIAAPGSQRPRLAIVVQRYGHDIGGGAELHARYIAEHLARQADVRVLTTCARDYVTWRNDLPAGEERVNGIPVERFPVTRERDRSLLEFGRRSNQVFTRTHSLEDELRWLDAQGPVSPGLLERVRAAESEFDLVLAFSLRYHPAYHVACRYPRRTVLVPTVEREAALGLAIFPPVLRQVRAIMYNSPEERALLQALAGNEHVPGVVVGVGSEIPPDPRADRARRKFGLENPFLVYVGRIDVNKGEALTYINTGGVWKQGFETDPSIGFQLVSTPGDLARFIESLFDLKLISQNSLNQMKTIRDGDGLGMEPFTFAGKTFYGHTGGGDNYGAWLAYMPEEKLAVAYTTNAKVHPVVNIVRGVVDIYYNQPFQIPAFESIEVSPEILDKYVGVYSNPEAPVKFTITRDGATLLFQPPGESAVPLEATAQDEFRIEGAVVIQFDAAKNQMTIKRRGGERVFTKER